VVYVTACHVNRLVSREPSESEAVRQPDDGVTGTWYSTMTAVSRTIVD